MKKILKILAFSSIFTMLISTNATAAQELTGDTKLSCEAILCLSTGTRPGECAPSIARYFSISAKKWSDTIAKRKSFLNLCPTGDQQNQGLDTLKNQVLAHMQTDCTAQYLNTRVERKVFEMTGNKSAMPKDAKKIYCDDDNENYSYSPYSSRFLGKNGIAQRAIQCKWEEVRFRINPTLPQYCQDLIDHDYTDKNLKYTCDGDFKLQSQFKKDCWVENKN